MKSTASGSLVYTHYPYGFWLYSALLLGILWLHFATNITLSSTIPQELPPTALRVGIAVMVMLLIFSSKRVRYIFDREERKMHHQIAWLWCTTADYAYNYDEITRFSLDERSYTRGRGMNRRTEYDYRVYMHTNNGKLYRIGRWDDRSEADATLKQLRAEIARTG